MSEAQLIAPPAAYRDIPEPRTLVPGSSIFPMRRDPLGFLQTLSRYGDVAQVRIAYRRLVLVNEPELIREVLVTQDRLFTKGTGLKVAANLLGEGLLTSEGELHKRQRRLAQPAFHRQRIADYASVMASFADRWQSHRRDGEKLDMPEEMGLVTLRIAAKTLFDTEGDSELGAISDALTESMRLFQWGMLPFAPVIFALFPSLVRRFAEVRQRLDDVIYRIIRERRESGKDHGDLLSMLMLAKDVDGDGGSMSDKQLRDEALTLILAGHETTANLLAWTWYALSQNPEVESNLHEEIDTVLEGRIPNVEDLRKLTYTRQVISEAMRCYPPAWVIGRTPVEDVKLGPYTVRAGSSVLISPWVTHHDPRWYPDPKRFDPDRWTPEAIAARPRFAYLPFGGGSRLCIGEQFAWMEAVLILAALASRWSFRLMPEARVEPQPLVTLRLKHGLWMTAHRRTY